MKLTRKNKAMIYGAWKSLDGSMSKEKFADGWNISIEALDNIIIENCDLYMKQKWVAKDNLKDTYPNMND